MSEQVERSKEIPAPTTEDVARDLAADLDDCSRLWRIDPNSGGRETGEVLGLVVDVIAPAAIRRAHAAETALDAALSRLRELARQRDELLTLTQTLYADLKPRVDALEECFDERDQLRGRVKVLERALREIAEAATMPPTQENP